MARFKIKKRKQRDFTIKDKLKTAAILGGVFLLCAAWIAFLATNKPGEAVEVSGKLLGIHQNQDERAGRRYLIIELSEDDQRVLVKSPQGHVYRHDAEVLLWKIPMSHGSPKYQWLRYYYKEP